MQMHAPRINAHALPELPHRHADTLHTCSTVPPLGARLRPAHQQDSEQMVQFTGCVCVCACGM
ncbi:hypothetical protein EON67_09310 [archaeon]|nr:MAG: hypothetical protein EON67_09310 [archaeon]